MPFNEGSYSGINDFVDLLRGLQIKEDLDALIGVSGFKGFGKSSFSKQVIIRYVEKYFGVNFTPSMLEKYTAYTEADLSRLLDELPEYAPIDCDEAVNFAMGEDWMRSDSKKLKKVFAKIRNKHHIFFFNIPDLWWLDKKYRENMMTVWIHIIKKGYVMMSLPNIAPGIEDRWDRAWLQKKFTKSSVNYFTPTEDIMRRMRKYTCFCEEFKFPKLPEAIYQKHLDLRNSKVMQSGQEEEIDSKMDIRMRKEFKALPMQIKLRWPEFQQWMAMIKEDGGVPTTQYIYDFFYKPKIDILKVNSPTTLNEWISSLGYGKRNWSNKTSIIDDK